MNPNLMGTFSYTPYSYPEPYQLIQMVPVPFNQFNNYGYKNNWQGVNKGYYGNNNRNNYHKGNKKYNNYNNRQHQQQQQQQKNEVEEDTNKNKNKIVLIEYNKLENEQDKKDYLGEKIFKAIEDSLIVTEKNIDMETIGKITGMIIELPEKNEILEILENTDILNSRIEEALKLLDWKK